MDFHINFSNIFYETFNIEPYVLIKKIETSIEQIIEPNEF
jgi:hypothetical protein